jgi:hypothetical protein
VYPELLCPYAAPNRQATVLLVPRPPSLGGWKTCLFGSLQGRHGASKPVCAGALLTYSLASTSLGGAAEGLAAQYATTLAPCNRDVKWPGGGDAVSGMQRAGDAGRRTEPAGRMARSCGAAGVGARARGRRA